ncbi:MAG TPA: hypothetical protein V6C85_01590 [Allocoleopsis sp.]
MRKTVPFVFPCLTLISSSWVLGIVSPQKVRAETCRITSNGYIYVPSLGRTVFPEEYMLLNNPCTRLNTKPEDNHEPSTSYSSESTSKADQIKQVAIKAAKNNRRNCSGSVREAALNLGIDLSVKTAGSQANNQVDYMEKNWRKVSMEEAKELADRGIFVVAGRKDWPHGHVTIVVKGLGVNRPDPVTGKPRVWPNIAGGSLGSGSGYSEGNKTILNAWFRRQLNEVRYYTPN